MVDIYYNLLNLIKKQIMRQNFNSCSDFMDLYIEV